MSKPDAKPYLTPNEVAEMLMVSPVTIRQWARKGLLSAETTPGGHRRFRREVVEQFIQQQGGAKTSAPGRIERILIVDDDLQFSGFLFELLSGGAHPVVLEVAHDGFDAGRKVQSFQPDCVLLDLNMPGMDGFQVCRQLKQDAATRSIRVIAITGFTSEENLARLREAGADACLAKPLDIAALHDSLGWR